MQTGIKRKCAIRDLLRGREKGWGSWKLKVKTPPKASQGWPVWMVKAMRGAAHSRKCRFGWLREEGPDEITLSKARSRSRSRSRRACRKKKGPVQLGWGNVGWCQSIRRGQKRGVRVGVKAGVEIADDGLVGSSQSKLESPAPRAIGLALKRVDTNGPHWGESQGADPVSGSVGDDGTQSVSSQGVVGVNGQSGGTRRDQERERRWRPVKALVPGIRQDAA